jgi:hypothetical protein
MPSYRDTQPDLDLVTAVRDDLDLPEAVWAELRAAATPYQRRCARMLVDPTCAPHGLPSTYLNYGCRCDLCRLGYSESRRSKSAQKDFSDDAPPTDRSPLAQALHARKKGWDLTPAAEELLAAYDAEQVL